MTLSYSSVVFGLLFVVTCATACGNSGGPDADLSPFVREQLATASEYQRAALRDGTVTAAEYEAAVLATLACLDDEGIPHSEPELQQRGRTAKWFYTYGPFAKEDEERVHRSYQQCYDEYEGAIASVWGFQSAPSEEETIELQEAVLKCLREHGIEVADYPAIRNTSAGWSSEEQAIGLNCKLLHFRGEDRFVK